MRFIKLKSVRIDTKRAYSEILVTMLVKLWCSALIISDLIASVLLSFHLCAMARFDMPVRREH